MKVIITGANGFIGSYLVKECLHQNMEVFVLVRKNANVSSLQKHPNLIFHSINYTENLIDQLSKLKESTGEIDYFIHNLGLTASLKKKDYYDVNVGITLSLIECILTLGFFHKMSKFVYLSSYAAAGPLKIKRPISHYGESKLEAEKIIQNKLKKHLLIRPTAVYGSGDLTFLLLFKTAKMGIYLIANSKQRMNLIHVSDLSRMIVNDMQSSEGIIHYSDGKTYYHDDLIKLFSSLFQKKIRKIVLPQWFLSLLMVCSDFWHRLIKKHPVMTSEKFSEISQDWDFHETDVKYSLMKPQISLKEGLKEALVYYREKKII